MQRLDYCKCGSSLLSCAILQRDNLSDPSRRIETSGTRDSRNNSIGLKRKNSHLYIGARQILHITVAFLWRYYLQFVSKRQFVLPSWRRKYSDHPLPPHDLHIHKLPRLAISLHRVDSHIPFHVDHTTHTKLTEYIEPPNVAGDENPVPLRLNLPIIRRSSAVVCCHTESERRCSVVKFANFCRRPSPPN